MPLFVEMEVRVGWVANSNPAYLAQAQANIPGQGAPTTAAAASGQYGVAPATGQNARTAFTAQVRQYITGEPIPVALGSEGSVTLANINTALTNCVSDLASASGTVLISPAEITMIQGWATGSP